MRLLWSLPKAAPALLRHIAAYIDLAILDLSQAKREWEAEFAAWALVLVCGVFALLLACMLVIALTWDTPHRVAAIAWMLGIFVAAAIAAAIYRGRMIKARTQLLSTVKKQWQEDRVLIERVLSDET